MRRPFRERTRVTASLQAFFLWWRFLATVAWRPVAELARTCGAVAAMAGSALESTKTKQASAASADPTSEVVFRDGRMERGNRGTRSLSPTDRESFSRMF